MQCPMKYKLKYVDGNYVNSEAIALDVGTIVHKAMEEKYKAIMEGKEVDYNRLLTMVQNGTVENHRRLIGISEIQDKYEDIYNEVNKKSNMTYHDKMEVFYDYFLNDDIDPENEGWRVLETEKNFRFVFEDRAILHGFIDRIDINDNGDIRVVDYKTANMPYQRKDIVTAMQMYIYGLACEDLYGKVPVEYVYDMVFHNEKQNAMSKGYEKRGWKKLHKVLDQIEEAERMEQFKNSVSPLCYFCNFCPNSPSYHYHPFMDSCNEYSLWRPDNKTFEVHREYKVNMGEIEF